MAERSIVARLRLEIGDYKRNADAAAKSTRALGEAAKKAIDDAAKAGDKATDAQKKAAADAQRYLRQQETAVGQAVSSIERNEQAWTTAGVAVTAFGAAAAAGVGMAVSAFADFDAQMSSVQAATHETADNMELLRDAAIEAGAETVFSAAEAAQGIEELAKAGISTADILSGGLAGALDLAAAGGISVGEAAETAASAMTQFKLAGSDVTHIADLLAAGAGKAQGGVSDMSAALNQSGLVASQMGLSIEETVGSLTAFASAGLVGSDAGTSFRAMLLRLANPTDESAALMDELGLRMYDTQGQFIGMEALAGQLQDRLGGLSDETRNQALAQIFGQDAIRTSSILYEQGAEGVAEWTAAVNDSGYAAETAGLMTDNLKGDLERLGGAWDTLMIGMGEGANGPLRSIIQSAESMVDWFGQLPQPVLNVATGLGAVAAAGGLTAGAFLLIVPRVLDTINGFKTLKDDLPKVATGFTKAGKAAGVATIAFAAAAAVGQTFGQKLDPTPVEDYTAALLDLENAVTAQDSPELVRDLAGAFDELANPGLMDRIDDVIDGVSGAFGVWGDLEVRRSQFDDLGKSLADLFASSPDLAAEKFEWALSETGATTEELLDLMPAYRDALTATDNEQKIAGESAVVLAEAQEAEAAATEEATKALQEWLDMVTESDASFIDLLGSYDSVIAKNEELGLAATATTDQWLAELERQVEAQTNWETNMLLLSGRVSQGVINELAKLGPEGAPLVADLVNASDEELARLESVYAQRSGEATGAFANNLLDAGPVLAQIASKMGSDAAAEAAAALAAGETTLQDVIAQYDLTVYVPIEMSGYSTTYQNLMNIQAAINGINNTHVRVATGGGGQGGITFGSANGGWLSGLAGGGWVPGGYPGPGIDNVLWPLNKGGKVLGQPLAGDEFVVRGSQARKHGPLLESINAGTLSALPSYVLPGRAGGGSVAAYQSASFGYAPQVNVAAPSLDGMRLTGRLDLGNGLSGFVDGRIESALDREGAWSR